MIDADVGPRENRILTRRQAERFVDRRNRLRIQYGFGALEDRRDIWTLVIFTFIMCLGIYGIAGKKKIGQVYIDEWDEA